MRNNPFQPLQVLSFLFIGVLNTVLGAFVMFSLYNFLHCSYWVSSICNYVAGGIFSFFMNKHFTFKDEEKSFLQFVLFSFVVGFCYFVSYFCAKNLVLYIFREFDSVRSDNTAMFIGMCLYTVLNFFGQKFIVFRKGRNCEHA